MNPSCSVCGYVHTVDDVVALGRFSSYATTYRARFPDSPVRTTREDADADMCAWRARKPRGTARIVVTPSTYTPPTPPPIPVAPQPFPAATVEHLAREKAWRDFLAQAAFSLHVWTLDGSLADVLPNPVDWLRDCMNDLSTLIARETTA